MKSRPTIPDVLDGFVDYLKQHAAWGSLHAVLEDGNVSDRIVRYCLNRAEATGDKEAAELARVLLRMSKTQRLKIDYSAKEDLHLHKVTK